MYFTSSPKLLSNPFNLWISHFRRVLNLVCFLWVFRRRQIFFIKPLNMGLTEGSETSAKLNLTPEKYAKENIQDLLTSFATIRTPVFIFNFRICPRICLIRSSEQTANISLNSINSPVFVTQITETQFFPIGYEINFVYYVEEIW
jgi:hypothetical protein